MRKLLFTLLLTMSISLFATMPPIITTELVFSYKHDRAFDTVDTYIDRFKKQYPFYIETNRKYSNVLIEKNKNGTEYYALIIKLELTYVGEKR